MFLEGQSSGAETVVPATCIRYGRASCGTNLKPLTRWGFASLRNYPDEDLFKLAGLGASTALNTSPEAVSVESFRTAQPAATTAASSNALCKVVKKVPEGARPRRNHDFWGVFLPNLNRK